MPGTGLSSNRDLYHNVSCLEYRCMAAVSHRASGDGISMAMLRSGSSDVPALILGTSGAGGITES